ncbi:MAG: thiosulfate oxidation carrier complex protein SoxZ [Gammaproteobacteria bacterium]|nr:thiosulfate oxidation carrier complex protein SoxZ [Gammaproteobacteria bacterium]
MNRSSITIRAKQKGDFTEVRLLVRHPMQSGKCQPNIKSEEIFIQELRCFYKKQQVIMAQLGIAVAENPYFTFRFKGGTPGDMIKISWVDNQGNRDDQTAEIH